MPSDIAAARDVAGFFLSVERHQLSRSVGDGGKRIIFGASQVIRILRRAVFCARAFSCVRTACDT